MSELKKSLVTYFSTIFLLGFFFFSDEIIGITKGLYMIITENHATKKIEKDMEKRFGEPFVTDRYYIYPERYVGTHFVNDEYYKREFDIQQKFPLKYYENYSKVALAVSANEFYQPKVEELFGKNVVLALEPQWDNEMWDKDEFTDYKTGLDYFKKLQNEYQGDDDAPYHKLEGGIYIYGRVDSDADREEYREKIWEFINYIKEVGAFDQVDLGIIVVDERVLTDQFASDKELKADIVEARYQGLPRDEAEEEVYYIEQKYESSIDRNYLPVHSPEYEYSDDEEFRVKRRELMSKITEPVDKSKKHERLEHINIHNNYKSKGGSYRNSFYNTLLYIWVVSKKQWDTAPTIYEDFPYTDFNKINDIEFRSEEY